MKKLLTWTIPVLLIISLIGVTVIQLKWIKHSILIQQKQFSALVNKILDQAIQDYEQHEIIYKNQKQIISVSPDSALSFNIQSNPNIRKFLNSKFSAKKTRFFIYQEKPNRDFLSFNDYEFAKKVNPQSKILYITEFDKTTIAKKIDLQNRLNANLLKRKIDSALKANDIKKKYEFAILDKFNQIVYKTPGYSPNRPQIETYSKSLFPHSKLQFDKFHIIFYFEPEKASFFHNLTNLVISTIIFTVFLLILSLATVFIVFKQKRLSELKTQFVNNVSHELKTPIATIQLAAQMLTDKSLNKDENEVQRLAEIIKKENERMRFNVEKILQTSVIEKGRIQFNKQPIHAHELIDKVEKSFNLQVKQKNGLIIKNFKANNDLIYVDEVHFTNVLINLLENALKYNEGEPIIEIETLNENDYLVIKVQDNGIGIPHKDLKRIFDQFYRAQHGDVHNYKSFGLGLSYVKKIIEEHNGKITASSEVGEGSTFTIYLPLYHENKNSKIQKNG